MRTSSRVLPGCIPGAEPPSNSFSPSARTRRGSSRSALTTTAREGCGRSSRRKPRRTGLDHVAIRLALAAAEHRSLRRAAHAMGVGEPALSHRIRALEDALTVSLFHRSPQGVQPTHAGEAFFETAREALSRLDQAAANAAAASLGAHGHLTLALAAPLAGARLREALALFRASHPDIDLRVIEASRAKIIEGLSERTIDMALLIGSPDTRLGEALPLWRERLHLVAPKDHHLNGRDTVGWAALSGEAFVVAGHGGGEEAAQRLGDLVEASGPRPSIRTHHVGLESLLAMVSLGFGLSVMTESELGRLPDNLVAIPLAGDGALAPMVAYRDPSNANPPVRRFWSMLKRRYAAPSPGSRSCEAG